MGRPNLGTAAILVGIAVVFFGIGLAFWGQQIEVRNELTSSVDSGGVVILTVSGVRKPAWPVGMITAVGGLVLVFGVAYRVRIWHKSNRDQ